MEKQIEIHFISMLKQHTSFEFQIKQQQQKTLSLTYHFTLMI